jgi:hypothetical protein
LLEVGEDIADVGLTAEEARELLGRTGHGLQGGPSAYHSGEIP